MLRTILEDPALTVEDVIVQSSERNLFGRSVRLDALCTLGSGTLVNIEVQRLKDTEGGMNAMCAVLKHYEDIARNEGRNEGRAEGKLMAIVELVKAQLLGIEDAAKAAGMTVAEFSALL